MTKGRNFGEKLDDHNSYKIALSVSYSKFIHRNHNLRPLILVVT